MALCEKCGKELNKNGVCEDCEKQVEEITIQENDQTITQEQAEVEVVIEENVETKQEIVTPKKSTAPTTFFGRVCENIRMMIETPKALAILVIISIASVIACFAFASNAKLFSDTASVAGSNFLLLIIWAVFGIVSVLFSILSIICNAKRIKEEKEIKK